MPAAVAVVLADGRQPIVVAAKQQTIISVIFLSITISNRNFLIKQTQNA